MNTQMLSVGLTVEALNSSTASAMVVTPVNLNCTLVTGEETNEEIAKVSGGIRPYVAKLNAESKPLPAGLQFAVKKNEIFLTGTPTATVTSNLQILLDVSDSSTPEPVSPVAGAPVKPAATKGTWGAK